MADMDREVVGYCYAAPYRSRPAYRFTVENRLPPHGARHRLLIALRPILRRIHPLISARLAATLHRSVQPLWVHGRSRRYTVRCFLWHRQWLLTIARGTVTLAYSPAFALRS